MGSGEKRVRKNRRARHRRNHLVIPPGGGPTIRKGRILSPRPFLTDRVAAQFNAFAAAAPRSRATLLVASYRMTPGSGYTLTQRADEAAFPSAPRGALLLS